MALQHVTKRAVFTGRPFLSTSVEYEKIQRVQQEMHENLSREEKSPSPAKGWRNINMWILTTPKLIITRLGLGPNATATHTLTTNYCYLWSNDTTGRGTTKLWDAPGELLPNRRWNPVIYRVANSILPFSPLRCRFLFSSPHHFLLPPPRDRSSRLRWSGSSREPLATAAREREVALDSPGDGFTLWVLDGRLPLLLENNLLVRLYCCSLGSTDEPGLLLDAIALLDALPVREDVRGLSTVLSPDRSVLCIWENRAMHG